MTTVYYGLGVIEGLGLRVQGRVGSGSGSLVAVSRNQVS